MSQAVEDRLNQIPEKILSQEFLKSQGLGNEIGFWIFDYDAADELKVRAYIDLLTESFSKKHTHVDFWVPKGANRFHFVGGSRFVHGGAMPQEIVVPVITVKSLRDKKADQKTTRKVKVISPTTSLKMVNNIQKFEFLQTEEVGGVLTANTITVAIYDGDKQVSSEETITFDASGDNFNDRKKHVLLSLLGNNFDRNKDYFLIIKDKQLGTENYRYKVSIDLIADDFF